MSSKYDTYWQDRLNAILRLIEEARTTGKSSPLSVEALSALGSRRSWYGKLEIVNGQAVYSSAAHMRALGRILVQHLPPWATEFTWSLVVSQDCELTAERIDADQTSRFESAYRDAKLAETIQHAEAHFGPLTLSELGAPCYKTPEGMDLYVLFCSKRDGWFAPRAFRIDELSERNGYLLFSFTDEAQSTITVWHIPLADLVARIQQQDYQPTLDGGNAYSFNIQTTDDADIIKQLDWDIRPYRLEFGPTDLTRATFNPTLVRDGKRARTSTEGQPSTDDVIERLEQWKVEATDPQHPNYYHADLDHPAKVRSQISELLAKLRATPEAFGRDDVVALFGALNSGWRIKNKVADENPLPVLRDKLVGLLDGEDNAADKIDAAARAIRFASHRVLGELYGWAHADTAPLYNSCATNALHYLGYAFDDDDYDAFVAAHEQFKQVYEQHVGRLRPDLPVNLEIDKLYNVIDKVDLKQLPLGRPFNQMFADREEAEWAFELLALAVQRLGITDPEDPRASFNLRYVHGEYQLRLIYGSWLVLAIGGKANALTQVILALLTDQVDLQPQDEDRFTVQTGERPAALYRFPVTSVRPFEGQLRQAYEASLDYIRERFGHWTRSNLRPFNRPPIAKAVFDPRARDRLLRKGIDTPLQRFWKIAPGENAWNWDACREGGFIAMGWDEIGDISGLSRAEFNARRDELVAKLPDWTKVGADQLWMFAQIQEGDRIVTNRGTTEVLGIGTVVGPYEFVPGVRHGHRLPVKWDDVTPRRVDEGGWRRTLVELDGAKFEAIRKAPPVGEVPEPEKQPRYTLGDFVADTGFTSEEIVSWERTLRRKMHIVFQGPPGTGKTYVAERLARLIVSETTGFWDVMQFHPAYAYEDFVQGIRPTVTEKGLTYDLVEGRFLEFCRKARREANGAPCVLIIDEINRAHLSRVLGELMYLLEYRNKAIPLAAGGDPFQIPNNVYLIGTMNTADRSIALVDHALRRRFSFIRLKPDHAVLRRYLAERGYDADACMALIEVLKQINAAIDDHNYELGISFFMRPDDELKEVLPDIWTREIEPYLEEFFYDQPGKVGAFRWGTLAESKLKDWAT